MKSTLTAILLLSGAQAFAMDMNLNSSESVTVEELLQSEATSVSCQEIRPKCVLQGSSYGVQYPSQEFSDVHLSEANSEQMAIYKLKNLKDEGICQF